MASNAGSSDHVWKRIIKSKITKEILLTVIAIVIRKKL